MKSRCQSSCSHLGCLKTSRGAYNEQSSVGKTKKVMVVLRWETGMKDQSFFVFFSLYSEILTLCAIIAPSCRCRTSNNFFHARKASPTSSSRRLSPLNSRSGNTVAVEAGKPGNNEKPGKPAKQVRGPQPHSDAAGSDAPPRSGRRMLVAEPLLPPLVTTPDLLLDQRRHPSHPSRPVAGQAQAFHYPRYPRPVARQAQATHPPSPVARQAQASHPLRPVARQAQAPLPPPPPPPPQALSLVKRRHPIP